ncbi:hypothetical protein K0U07_01335 [bacterium]|nr:hypothetical protein [bacterium]
MEAKITVRSEQPAARGEDPIIQPSIWARSPCLRTAIIVSVSTVAVVIITAIALSQSRVITTE